MPQERHNPFPMPTAEEVAEWQKSTDPATAAARNIISRNIGGLYRRPYLRGDSDHAPILKGIADLAAAQMALCLAIDEANVNGKPQELPTAEEWGKIIDANAEVMSILEHHGCPTHAEAAAAEAVMIENMAKED